MMVNHICTHPAIVSCSELISADDMGVRVIAGARPKEKGKNDQQNHAPLEGYHADLAKEKILRICK